MSDSDSDDDYHNLANYTDEEINNEIKIREYTLTAPNGNTSMRNAVQARLDKLRAEIKRRKEERRKNKSKRAGGSQKRKSKKARRTHRKK